MKKSSFIVTLSIIFIIAVTSGYGISAYINRPSVSECPYEYGECPNPHCSNYGVPINQQMREYQIELEQDGTYIYENNRYVGFLPFDSTQAFDKMMLRDNL